MKLYILTTWQYENWSRKLIFIILKRSNRVLCLGNAHFHHIMRVEHVSHTIAGTLTHMRHTRHNEILFRREKSKGIQFAVNRVEYTPFLLFSFHKLYHKLKLNSLNFTFLINRKIEYFCCCFSHNRSLCLFNVLWDGGTWWPRIYTCRPMLRECSRMFSKVFADASGCAQNFERIFREISKWTGNFWRCRMNCVEIFEFLITL